MKNCRENYHGSTDAGSSDCQMHLLHCKLTLTTVLVVPQKYTV